MDVFVQRKKILMAQGHMASEGEIPKENQEAILITGYLVAMSTFVQFDLGYP